MNLPQQFIDFVKKEQLFSANDHLLIAVSGGLDSVALCHLCRDAGFTFSIAHCNFGLRALESDRDAEFVKDFAQKLQVPFFFHSFDTAAYASANKLSIQVAARDLRYSWFADLLSKNKELKWLLTAHHADDHAETALIQFCKGTGISGLKGISVKRGFIVRPLLFATKKDIKKYALEKGFGWVEDSSNEEIKYTRNYFRNGVIPTIEKIIPQVHQNINHTIVRLQETETLYRQAIDLHKKKLLEINENEIQIPVLKLAASKPLNTIIFEIIKDYNFSPQQVSEVVKLLDAESGKYILSATHRILRNRKWLIISTLNNHQQSVITIDEGLEKVRFENKELTIRLRDGAGVKLSENAGVACLAANELTFPLLLRKWKAGDYFYPLGMQKKKKLSRFFIDQKLSLTDKENVWVIESKKRIAWVVNHRIDDRFKIKPTTEKIVQLTWSTL